MIRSVAMPAALALVASLALTLGATVPAPAATVDVGVAKVDVTPGYPVRLSGYASRKAESQGVGGKLWVKAMAFGSDAEGPSIVLTVDNLGVPEAITAEVAARLKDKGIRRERIAVCASHTHSAPMLSGCAINIFGKPLEGEEKAHVDRYTRAIVDAMESAAIAALKDRRPASLSHGRGTAGFAVNRRVVKDGKWTGFGEAKVGPVDHSLPVIRATDASGKLIGVMALYACHCTTLKPEDNLIHGDWAGLAQEYLEAEHPGAVAMTLIGCGADANPRNRPGLDVAKGHGRELANEVNRLIGTTLTPINSAPTATLKRVLLPFDKIPTRDELVVQAKKPGHEGANAAIQLARLDGLGAIPAALDYPIQVWRFGDDLAMVFLAGEVVVDYAIALKAEFDPDRLWVAAYANDAPCYIPSDRILAEGGYEADGAMLYYALPSRLKTGVEGLILSGVRAQMPGSFKK